MNSPVIANEVKQSMQSEVMDRHASLAMTAATPSLRGALRRGNPWSPGLPRFARSDDFLVQGPCVVSGRIRRGRNDGGCL